MAFKKKKIEPVKNLYNKTVILLTLVVYER